MIYKPNKRVNKINNLINRHFQKDLITLDEWAAFHELYFLYNIRQESLALRLISYFGISESQLR